MSRQLWKVCEVLSSLVAFPLQLPSRGKGGIQSGSLPSSAFRPQHMQNLLSQKKLIENTSKMSEFSLVLLFLAVLLSPLLRYRHDRAALRHRCARSLRRQGSPGRCETPAQRAPGNHGQCPAAGPSWCSTAHRGRGERAWKHPCQLPLLQPSRQNEAASGARLQVQVGLGGHHRIACPGGRRVSPSDARGHCCRF